MDIRNFFRPSCEGATRWFNKSLCESDGLFQEQQGVIVDDFYGNMDKKEKRKKRKKILELLEKEYWDNHPTHFLETTRFDSASAFVNKQARGEGCLYGNPRPIKKRVQPFRLVLELNNDTNRIDGVGLISDKCLLRGSRAAAERDVYENRLFNQNVYRGPYRLDRSVLDNDSDVSFKIFRHLDSGCFHGFYHVKRGNSISKLPFVHILDIQKEFGVDLVEFIRSLMKKNLMNKDSKNI